MSEIDPKSASGEADYRHIPHAELFGYPDQYDADISRMGELQLESLTSKPNVLITNKNRMTVVDGKFIRHHIGFRLELFTRNADQTSNDVGKAEITFDGQTVGDVKLVEWTAAVLGYYNADNITADSNLGRTPQEWRNTVEFTLNHYRSGLQKALSSRKSKNK